MFEIFGYIATILSTTFSLPQLIKTYKIKNVEGLSWTSAFLGWFLILSWLIYGIGINSIQLLITESICIVSQTIWIIFMFKYSRTKI